MSEEIDRWVKFMKENPDKWKKIHSEFIDAQFDKASHFIDRLLKQPNGKEKVVEVYGIDNKKGYQQLLG